MILRRSLVVAALALACSSAPDAPPPCDRAALAQADEALAARADEEARAAYQALLVCGEMTPEGLTKGAHSGLALLSEPAPSLPVIGSFLEARGSSNSALDTLLQRFNSSPPAMTLLCAWLDEGSENPAPRRLGQLVRCLEHQDPPDPVAEVAANMRLQAMPWASVDRIAGLGIEGVSAPLRTCIEEPESPPAVTATCSDRVSVGALSRLAHQAADALALTDGPPGPRTPAESARCLRRVGLMACLQALAGGCACEGWAVVQPALQDILGPTPSAETLAAGTALTVETLRLGGSPWTCGQSQIDALTTNRDTDSLRALRLLHVSLVQALPPEPRGRLSSADYACARTLTCALGDPEILDLYLPNLPHAPCTASGPTTISRIEEGKGKCGDGRKQLREECDDGNRNDADACTNACKLPKCGDGRKQLGEECDDGNRNDADACTNACRLPKCGDGIKGPRESCDDGNTVNDDNCTNACTLPRCGDSIVQKVLREACDPPGQTRIENDAQGRRRKFFCSRQCEWRPSRVFAPKPATPPG